LRYSATPPTAAPATTAAPMTTPITTARAVLRRRVSAAPRATDERRSSFRSVVVASSALMLSGSAPVGSTPPPSGSPSTSDLTPPSPGWAAGFESGARAAISSLARAASAEAPIGFQVASAAAAGATPSVRVDGSCRGSAPRADARGTGARYSASSFTVVSGAQSDIPGRHTSESGPTSPASHFRFTSASGSGPTCAWPMATYHSVAAETTGLSANTLAASSDPMSWVAARSGMGVGAAAAAAGAVASATAEDVPPNA
jgi:hypothetical protein